MRGRKTATIRLGDKSGKYRKNQAVLVTIGYQYSPRERIFEAVIDQVEVMKVSDLSPRDIKHDNPEFRRHEELIHFLEQIYGRPVSMDDVVTVVRFSQILDKPSGMTEAMKGFGGAQNSRRIETSLSADARCAGFFGRKEKFDLLLLMLWRQIPAWSASPGQLLSDAECPDLPAELALFVKKC